MRGRWIWSDVENRLVPAEEYRREKHLQMAKSRSDLPAPHVISDGMESTLNHANGQYYDSKSAYQKAVRGAGCEIVGNEKLPEPKPYEPEGVKEDIRNAINEAGSH